MTQDINLAPLRIIPSKRLWQLQLLAAFLLTISSLSTTVIIFLAHPVWWIAELAFIAALGLWLWFCFKARALPICELRIYAGELFLKTVPINTANKYSELYQESTEIQVSLCGENLIWPWIIILNFRAVNQDKNLKIITRVILNDSCSPEDWRRLRVYLLNQLELSV